MSNFGRKLVKRIPNDILSLELRIGTVPYSFDEQGPTRNGPGVEYMYRLPDGESERDNIKTGTGLNFLGIFLEDFTFARARDAAVYAAAYFSSLPQKPQVKIIDYAKDRNRGRI